MEPVGDFEYSKKDLIGHGAFAVVFKGRHRKKQDFVVAIKCITKKNLAKSQNLLSKEIKILRELSDLHHENVVGLLDCKETSHHVYLVMEYCNGGDLADFLQAKGTLSEDTISAFLRQIAGAMKALNAKGIVHRDLKPQNILLCYNGPKPNPHPKEMTLKIADFGFARFLQDGVMAATLCGSPMYMAPEVIMSLQYDAKADLWSVGTIVYQCLTGKAPFQAQTPQQLKQFYERNANLAPIIQGGTSPELRDLLMKLLKRNSKDRMDFDEFFNHPFLHPRSSQPKSSSPVPVPRSRSRSTSSDSPPLKTVTASPLSGNLNMPQTPPCNPPINPALQRVRQQAPEPMDCQQQQQQLQQQQQQQQQSPHDSRMKGSPPQGKPLEAGAVGGAVGGTLHPHPAHGPSMGARCASPAPEDFVMVQAENIPPDHVVGAATGGHKPPSSVDLNAIFSDNSPGSPKHMPRAVRGQGASPRRGGHDASPDSGAQSPSRPSSLPVSSPVSSPPSSGPSSTPIPVPTQVKAFEQMQRSSPGSASPGSRTTPSPGISRTIQHAYTCPQISATGAQGVPIPSRGSSSNIPDIGSLSPPSVQFTIGTPPNTGWGRKNSFGTPPSGRQSITPPSNSSSPLRRSGVSPPPGINPNYLPGPSSLPTIVGSPTKVTTGFQFPIMDAPREISPTSPLQTPFGTSRTKTCPDNIAAIGFSPESNSKTVAVRCSTDPDALTDRLRRNSSGAKLSDKLSDQLWRAAFGNQISPTGNAGGSPGSGVVVPYSSSPSSLPHDSPINNMRERSSSFKDRTGSFDKAARRSSPYEVESPTSRVPYCQSPPNMEGPISFVAPELAEETLMDKEHNETVAKLGFVLALVESIVELAQSRSSPITESVDQRQGNTFRLDHTSFVSEGQRQLEQLVLYVRSLQLLSSSIELAREEVKANRLQPSNNVKTIIKEMNNYYHQCLSVCRLLHNKGVGLSPDVNPHSAAITADKLIYSYAIEMCQTAALDELFGNPQDCFRRYRSAQILLHSLAQQAHNSRDRELINKYKESVEKRLYNLTSGGYVQAYSS